PELATVYWRPRVSEVTLARSGWLWTLTTAGHTIPFLAAAGLLIAFSPVTLPVALAALAQAWIIPELYAARGANVVRPRGPSKRAAAEQGALGLLGDLVSHDSRELHAQTGLVLEQGAFGAWLIAEAGAILVRPGGRRVHCYCVKATDAELPSGDRIAHLLLALRTDESGFATVANVTFSGARWRLRRRLAKRARPALARALATARAMA
ncbi:MAG TPA: hypothetical protein VG275_11300, partial [Solirubrobacteraceae bacterium]|nr:hypothetical protein [Solirubrobacteraceae bacterium]